MFARTLFVILTTALLAGCKGADGATGPQGAPGGLGQSGVATKFFSTVIVGDNGAAQSVLPADVNADPLKPSTLTCYLTAPGSNTWLTVSGRPNMTEPYCTLVFGNGRWVAAMSQAPVGWLVAFVVLY